MNKAWKRTLVIRGKVYVAWKRKMLHDVIDGHQAYIIFIERYTPNCNNVVIEKSKKQKAK